FAAKFIGGEYAHRDHKGDPNGRAPLVPVEAKKQREALRLLCDHILADGAIQLPKEALPYMAAGRWSHWGSDDWSADVNYALSERILRIQRMALSLALSPTRLENVHDAELALAEDQDALTLPEVLSTVSKAVFGELNVTAAVDGGVSESDLTEPT